MANTALNMPLLIPDGLFTCPRCGPTNAITQLMWTGSLTTLLAGRCRRCEHPYQFTVGNPSTTTTGSANTAGATVFTVTSGSSFSTVGAWVVVDSASADGGGGGAPGLGRGHLHDDPGRQ